MKLALLLFPAILGAGDLFIDNVSHPGGLAPGGFAEIDGFGFDGTAKVTVGGLNAAVYTLNLNAGGEASIFIEIPGAVAVGSSTLVLTQGKDSVSWPVTIVAAAPQFAPNSQPPYFGLPLTPNLRIERSLPGGGFALWSCAAGDTAKAGDLVRAYMTGLGATNPQVSSGAPAPESPLASTVIQPKVLFGKSVAEVTESVLAPGQVGLYRVTFKIPDAFGLQTLSVTAGGITVETPLAVGNAIMALPQAAAPSSIQVATACGAHFLEAGATLIGDPKNPPQKLGAIGILVTDSTGLHPGAGILSATQDQIEYIVPEGTSTGTADLAITIGAATWRGTLDIRPYAPQVLQVASAIAATYVVRVRNGVQTMEPTFRVAANGQYEAVPIDLGPEGDSVYLCVFGTGWRARGSVQDVTLQHSRNDGTYLTVPAIYAGAQGEYAGVDQANFLLPRSLAGTGNLFTFHTFLGVGGLMTGLPGLVYK